MNTHITEITSPISRTLLTQPKINAHLEVLRTQYLLRTILVDLLWLATGQDREYIRAVSGNKGNTDTGRVKWDGERDRARRGQDAAPTRRGVMKL